MSMRRILTHLFGDTVNIPAPESGICPRTLRDGIRLSEGAIWVGSR